MSTDTFPRDHFHAIDGRDEFCEILTHCPAVCACPVDECTAAVALVVNSGPCPACGRSIGWDGHPYRPCTHIVNTAAARAGRVHAREAVAAAAVRDAR